MLVLSHIARLFSPSMELTCQVQCYPWGKVGHESEVGALHSANAGAALDPSTTYAELWMGTHPNAPSMLANQQPLGAWLAEHSETLGEGVRAAFGNQLPFLFKVLSINKALSIQAHPDKVTR